MDGSAPLPIGGFWRAAIVALLALVATGGCACSRAPAPADRATVIKAHLDVPDPEAWLDEDGLRAARSLSASEAASVAAHALDHPSDLWAREEGRSDLSVECTIAERGDGSLDFEVDNIHVL